MYSFFVVYVRCAAWKLSKYRVFSGPYLGTFHRVLICLSELFKEREQNKFRGQSLNYNFITELVRTNFWSKASKLLIKIRPLIFCSPSLHRDFMLASKLSFLSISSLGCFSTLLLVISLLLRFVLSGKSWLIMLTIFRI